MVKDYKCLRKIENYVDENMRKDENEKKNPFNVLPALNKKMQKDDDTEEVDYPIISKAIKSMVKFYVKRDFKNGVEDVLRADSVSLDRQKE